MEKSRCAIYCRLSKDDGTTDESSSIQNQKDALTKYAFDHNFEIHDIYIDDGYTGTNFNRPAFKRMIDDINAHKFNVLLTKDLSRLSRNYLQAGYYMEDFFPKNHIRYIAVNDNYDSDREDNEFAPFKNIINEWYAKDISKKVKYAFNNLAKNGKIPGGPVALYGYDYDNERNRVINPITSIIVKRIFDMYLEYQSTNKIVDRLIAEHVICPGYYFYQTYGINPQKYANCSEEDKCHWNTNTVGRILTNEEYTGKLILNKTKNEKLGGKKGIRTAPEEKIIHDNRFPAIITKEKFQEVKTLMSRNKNSVIGPDVNKLKGMIVCENCGKQMIVYHKIFYRCNCRTCRSKATFDKETLENAVKNDVLNLKTWILMHEEALIEYAKRYSNNKEKKEDIHAKERKRLKEKLNQVNNYIQKLFEANLANQIPTSTYNLMMAKYKEEHSQIEMALKSIATEVVECNYNEYLEQFITALKNINEDNVLNNQMLLAIIDKITCHKNMITHNYGTITMTIHYHKIGQILEDFINEKNFNS